MRPLAALCLLLCAAHAAVAFAPDPPSNLDKILSLPGIDVSKLPYDIYGGYIQLNGFSNTQLFYWFVESATDPSTDPLVLWMNGGPGCSSLFSLFQENGPFRVVSSESGALSLETNPFSWNHRASVIYLETPFGTGFSIDPTNSSSYESSDTVTAKQNLSFLERWFTRYPNYAHSPLFLAGEGYAGHFVPQLADQIRQYNERSASPINLAGFLVGNPVTDETIDENNFYPFMVGQSFAPLSAGKALNESCNGSVADPSPQCQAVIQQLNTEMGNFDESNIYGACDSAGASGSVYECISTDLLQQYLNMATVQLNIHVSPSSWDVCSERVEYQENVASVLGLYPQLLRHYRALVYSGDVDAQVTALGTQKWVAGLALPVRDSWAPWKFAGQIAGYRVRYENLTFATLKGAGHVAAADKPAQALDLFEAFLWDFI
eukprot:TRINITY_DN385_c2_g1_i1.p1 TRINITY_DN385_c2_g1~~TRINITY_DN385_c2_g1_i1.p1  ORF type:complete len:433 (-),score=107.44 TRINITY_DN385_c2_g1_i1:406-1704(-)